MPASARLGALLGAVALSACMTSNVPGTGGGGGATAGAAGAKGSGGAAGANAGGASAGGATSDAGNLSCSQTPTGCFCLRGMDGSQPSACSAASVATAANQQGQCCDDGSSLCKCDAYVCKSDPATQQCECGTSYTVNQDLATGTTTTACPAPTGTQKCCLTLGDTNTCLCSVLACQDATMVASCSLATVMVCGSGQQAVASCK
jgi:hypothetical protein